MTPRVAVIVPVYDDARRLRRCVAALVALADEVDGALEVVVADNGSRDAPAEAVAGLPHVRVVAAPEPGSYAARNVAVAASSAPVLAFTDADCVPRPGWLRAGLAALEGPPPADLAVGEIELFDEGPVGGTDPAVRAYEELTAFRQQAYAVHGRFGPTANLFVRRAAFEAVGGFDAGRRSGGDKDFGRRATGAGHRLVFAPTARVAHPFRGRRADLEAKVRRVVGGDVAGTRGRPSATLRLLARYALKPLRTGWWAWRRRRERPAAAGLAAAALALRVLGWQLDEVRRLARGAEPRR